MSVNSHTNKKKKQRQYKSNLRRINIVVTAQTYWHLKEMCAMNGWGEKDVGRVVDKLMAIHCAARGEKTNG